jgi:hypothetical protein
VRQYRRNQLNLCYPTEPKMKRSRKVEEQQREKRKEKEGERNSDFFEHRIIHQEDKYLF